jgi:hypothetical protein
VHKPQRGFEASWLSMTFSKAIFLGNGLVAIVAGLLANYLVDDLQLGPTAPFDAAAILLAIGGCVVYSTWTENYGDVSENGTLLQSFAKASKAIASGTWHALSVAQRHACVERGRSSVGCYSGESKRDSLCQDKPCRRVTERDCGQESELTRELVEMPLPSL